MSAKSLPLIFINMGGEMMYILDQRLKAQSVPTDKTKKGTWHSYRLDIQVLHKVVNYIAP